MTALGMNRRSWYTISRAMRFTGKGHGKFILMGEHAVVYGEPAIGMHLERGITVSLGEPSRGSPGKNLAHLDDRGREAFVAAARAVGVDTACFRVTVASRLPVGQGLGSSAALSVAASRALLRAAGETFDDARVLDIAQVLEKVFHGTPSGIDATIALGKGPVFYRKGAPPEPVLVGAPIPVVVLLSGTSPSTKAMVERVRRRREEDGPGTDRILGDIGGLVREARELLRAGSLAGLGRAMDENHRLLERLGVSTDGLESLVAAARRAGALGAKLTGGGGGGAVISLAGDRHHAREIMKTLNLGQNSFMTMVQPLAGGAP